MSGDINEQLPPAVKVPSLSKTDCPGSNSTRADDVQTPNADVYQVISKLIPHILGILDTDGQAEFLSPSWYDFTGLTEAQTIGSGWAHAIHPEDVEGIMTAWVMLSRIIEITGPGRLGIEGSMENTVTT